MYVNDKKIDKNYKRIIDGGDIYRYLIKSREEYVNFIPSAIKSGGDKNVYENPKIVVRQIGEHPIASFDKNSLYSLNTIYNLYLHDNNYELKFILGIINSKLIGCYWKNNFYDHKPTFPKIKKQPLHSIPIRKIDFTNKHEKAQHDRMVKLVEQMLEAQKKHHESQTSILKQRIDILDKQIDTLVYELYGLTEEEIKIVEEG